MQFKHFSLMLIACAFVSFNAHAEAEQRANVQQLAVKLFIETALSEPCQKTETLSSFLKTISG